MHSAIETSSRVTGRSSRDRASVDRKLLVLMGELCKGESGGEREPSNLWDCMRIGDAGCSVVGGVGKVWPMLATEEAWWDEEFAKQHL